MEETNNAPQSPNTPQQSLTRKQRREQKRAAKLAGRTARQREDARNRIIFWAALIIIPVMLLSWMFTAKQQKNNPENNKEDRVVEDINIQNEWYKGNPEAKVTLLEYSDFQCPFCAKQPENINKLVQDFPNDLRVIFRAYPLPGHNFAIDATKAAEAAGQQGKYWEMNEMLFAKQDEWSSAADASKIFENYAAQLGLNIEQYKTAVGSSAVTEKISKVQNEAQKYLIKGTPTYYLNGKLIDQPDTYEDFKKLVADEIKYVQEHAVSPLEKSSSQ